MATNSKSNSSVATLDDDLPGTAAEAVMAAQQVQGNNHDAELCGRKVRVTFFEQEGDLGKDAIFTSLNGVAYNIPRNVPVDLPVEVLEIFTNARTRAVQTTLGGGQTERDVMRFAYQIHGELPVAA